MSFELNIFTDEQIQILKQQNAQVHFSSYGEDKVVYNFLGGKKTPGFYVDIGANHPFSHSNTYLFYLIGWRGINVEPLSHYCDALNIARPRDINVNLAIGRKTGEKREFLLHHQSGENGFSFEKGSFEENVQRKVQEYWKMPTEKENRVISKTMIDTITMEDLLEKYKNEFSEIDFVNIDVEGFELEVLKSNNWHKFLPKMILLEDYLFDADNLINNQIHQFMLEKNYKLFSRNMITSIYLLNGVDRSNV